jgi:hypothetical protein
MQSKTHELECIGSDHFKLTVSDKPTESETLAKDISLAIEVVGDYYSKNPINVKEVE